MPLNHLNRVLLDYVRGEHRIRTVRRTFSVPGWRLGRHTLHHQKPHTADLCHLIVRIQHANQQQERLPVGEVDGVRCHPSLRIWFPRDHSLHSKHISLNLIRLHSKASGGDTGITKLPRKPNTKRTKILLFRKGKGFKLPRLCLRTFPLGPRALRGSEECCVLIVPKAVLVCRD